MEWIEIVKSGASSNSGLIVIAGLIGALSSSLISYLKNKYDYNIRTKDQDKDSFQIILQERKVEREENRIEIARLKDQLKILQEKIVSLENLIAQHPFPEWSISFGKFTWCNMTMEHVFLAPLGKNISWLIGKSPEDIWPSEIAQILQRLDISARSSEYHVAFAHNLEINNLKYTFVKYGNVDIISGKLITYYGMAIPQSAMLGTK